MCKGDHKYMHQPLNPKKFLFIICTNDPQLLNECLYYIEHLFVPEGFEIDVVSISDAPSMTSAYNEAMSSSDAKYKIYLHQDVFILNRNFLADILSIFQLNSQIGMIGMVGYKQISSDGIMWHSQGFGNLYKNNPPSAYPPLDTYHYSISEDGVMEVALIDGLLIATAYDLPWNAELLTGWDFYDAFQSLRFLANNYRIVVPGQNYPWCMHDADSFSNMKNYDYFRQSFKRIAAPLLGKSLEEIQYFFKNGGKLEEL